MNQEKTITKGNQRTKAIIPRDQVINKSTYYSNPKPSFPPMSKKKKVLWIVLITVFVAIVLVLSITLPLVLKKKSPELIVMENSEEIVVHIKREINEVSRYQEVKYSQVEIGSKDSFNENNQIIYTDILFNIFQIENVTIPNKAIIYHAYAVLINMTTDVGGIATFVGGINIYHSNEDEMNSSTENSESKESSDATIPIINKTCENDNNVNCESSILSMPIAKFSFFTNGTLYQLFKPAVIDAFLWSTITDSIRQFTPILSKKLYNSTLRRLGDFETIERTSSQEKDTNVTTLSETTINQGGFNGLEVSDSEMKTSINTTVDESKGKISSVSSSSECLLKHSDDTMSDIKVDDRSPLKDFDKGNTSNVVVGGFDAMAARVNSTFTLIHSAIEPNTTEVISNITNMLTFGLVSDNEMVEGNRLRHLLKFPFEEYKEDIDNIPSSINILRLLESNSFKVPIEFSYSIFKFNLLGLQMGLNVVLKANMETDDTTALIVLKAGHLQLTLFKLSTKMSILDKLIQASQIVNQLSIKIIDLANDVYKIFKNEKISQIISKAEVVKQTLMNVYDIGQVFSDPFSLLNDNIMKIVQSKMIIFTEKITSIIDDFDSIVASIMIDGKTFPNKVIEDLKENTKEFFAYGESTFIVFHNKILGYLDEIDQKLLKIKDIRLDIYIESENQIKNITELYEEHVNNMFSGTMSGVNNAIEGFFGKLQESIGDQIDDIIILFTQNPFISQLLSPEERTNLINSVNKMQSTIQNQTQLIFAKLHLSNDVLASHEITANVDKALKELVQIKKEEFIKRGNELMETLKNKLSSEKLEILLSHLDSLDSIENSIKKIKIDGFKTYFNIPLLWSDFSKDVISSLYEVIHNLLLIKENDLQLISEEIKLQYKQVFKAAIKEINTNIIPATSHLQNNFSKQTLQQIFNFCSNSIVNSQMLAQKQLEDNFNLVNNYIKDIANYAQQTTQFYKQYKTQKYEKTVQQGMTKLQTSFMTIQNVIKSDIPIFIDSIKTSLQSHLKEILDNTTMLKYLSQFEELTVINDLLKTIKDISQSVDLYLEEMQPVFANQIQTIVSEIEQYYDKQMNQLLDNKQELDWLTWSPNDPDDCDYKYTIKIQIWPLPAKYYDYCKTSQFTNNTDLITDQYSISNFVDSDNEIYNSFNNNQSQTIQKLIQDTKQIEETIQLFFKESIDNNKPLNDLMESWKEMAIKFEDDYLSVEMKDKIIRSINHLAKGKTNEFTQYAKTKLKTLTEEYYTKFSEDILNFNFKPIEIPYRFNQIIQSASKDLINIDTEIEKTLNTSLDYGLNYTYSLIEYQFESFLDSFLSNFMPDSSVSIIQPLQTKIDRVIEDIRNVYKDKLDIILKQQTPLSTLRLLEPSNDIWNINWVKDEFPNLLSQLETVHNDIKSDIETLLSEFDEDYTLQSKKIDYGITLTLKSPNLINIGKTALDNCFDELRIDEFVASFKELSQSTLDFLKKELRELNNRFIYLEDNLIKRHHDNFLTQITNLFPMSKINVMFSPYINKCFSFTFNINNLFTEVIEVLKNHLSHTFDTEVKRITALSNDRPYLISKNYFEPLFEELTYEITQKIKIFLNEYLEESFQTFSTKILSKSQINDLLSEIEKQTDADIASFEEIEMLTKQLDIKKHFEKDVAMIKEKFNEYAQLTADVIKEKFDNKLKQPIVEDISKRLNTTFEWVKANLLSQFNYTDDTEIAMMPSEDFVSNIKKDFIVLESNVIQKIKEYNIPELYRDNLDNVDFTIGNLYDITQLTGVIESIRLEIKEESKDLITTQKKNIKNYLTHQLSFQSYNTLSLLFNSNDYYKTLKEKCIDNHIKISFNAINEKIKEMTDYTTMLLINTTSISGSLFDVFPQVVQGFAQQFQLTVSRDIMQKINGKITEYITKTQEKVLSQFDDLFKTELLESNDLVDVTEVIRNEINLFDTNVYKTALNEFYKNEVTKAKTSFITPMETEINVNIEDVISRLDKHSNQIVAIFKTKEIEKINEELEQIIKGILTVLGNIAQAIDNKICNYLFEVNSAVIDSFDLFIKKLSDAISPVSKVFDSIKLEIEENANKTLDSIADVPLDISNKLNATLLPSINDTKDKIIEIMKDFRETISNKIISFEREISQWFSPNNRLRSLPSRQSQLESQPHVRKTSTLSAMKLKKALDTLNSIFNDIKNNIKSLTVLSQVRKAFTQYKTSIHNGLEIIKNPINQVINQINTLMDKSFLKRFEVNIENILKTVKDTCTACISYIEGKVEDVVRYFEEYPSTIVDDLYNEAESQAESTLKSLLAKSIQNMPPINLITDDHQVSKNLLSTKIPLFGVPLCFDVDFESAYSYNLQIGVEGTDIILYAKGGGEASISASAYLSLIIVRFGGKITGLLGKGSVSFNTRLSLANFQVFIQGSIALKAYEFRASVFKSSCKLKIEMKCILGFCYPMITFDWTDSEIVGVNLFKGYEYNQTMEKLY